MASLVFKDKNGTVGFISGKYYDRVDNFFVELSVSDSYTLSHNQNDSMYFTIDAAVNGNINTFRQYKVNIGDVLLGSNSAGNINVVKSIPAITDIVTGLSTTNEKQLQTFSNYSMNRNLFEYDLPTGADVIVKIYITLNNIKYTAVCPSFLYKPIVPTLTNFQIHQNQSSSALEITGLNVNDINNIKYYPKQISILGEVIQQDNSLESDVTLGSIVVNDNNEYISDLSSMVALNSSGVVIPDEDVIPLSTNRYEIYTQPNSSGGVLYNETNADIIVHAIANSKETVEINYNSKSTNMLYLRAPVSISGVVPYDVINNYGALDSPTMKIMTVTLDSDWTGYEPSSIVFTLVTVNNDVPGANGAKWIFTTSTPLPYSSNGIYNINLNQMIYIGTSDSSDSSTHKLDNNDTSYELEVTAQWENLNNVNRSTKWGSNVIFTQELPPVVSVSAYNTWQPLSFFTNSNIVSDDTAMPGAGVTLSILKNDMFSGNESTRTGLDDISKTKFKIQYTRQSTYNETTQEYSWTNVPAGSMIQPDGNNTGNTLLLQGAADSYTAYKDRGNASTDGLFDLPGFVGYNANKIGSLQHPLFVYLNNTDGIYNEIANDAVIFSVTIQTTVDGYAPIGSQLKISVPTYSPSLYMIYKPLVYSWIPGSDLEPFMMLFNNSIPDTLALPMLVGTNDVNNVQSIYYSNALVSWVENSAITLPFTSIANGLNPVFSVDLGHNVRYSVIYQYTDPNGNGNSILLNSNSSIEYTVPVQGLPVRSDYAVTNHSTDYVYDNASDKLVFDLSMVAPSTTGVPNATRIDGIDLFITGVNNGNSVATFYNYADPDTDVEMYIPGKQEVSLSGLSGLVRGNSYQLVFKPFRDDEVVSKGDHVYPAASQWYQPPQFIYLETNVRNTALLYGWYIGGTRAEPYVNFSTNQLVIPMDIEQTPHYYGAYVNWYKNPALNVDVVNDPNPVPLISALAVSTEGLPEYIATYGNMVVYSVTYVHLSLDGVTQILGVESSLYNASFQGLPVSSDYAVTNHSTDYVYDNASDKLVFDLSMVAPSTTGVPNATRIDGIDLFITGVNNGNSVATFYNYADPDTDVEMYIPGKQEVSLSGLSGLVRGNSYQLVFKPFRDDEVVSKGDHVYPAASQWYQPPQFIYLETNVRNTALLYSWVITGNDAEPYVNFSTNKLVIPMDIGQAPNYYGVYVNWYKNAALNIDVVNDPNPVPLISALAGSTEGLPEYLATYGTMVVYSVTYVYLSLDGVTPIPGVESSLYNASFQNMPVVGDYVNSPAYNIIDNQQVFEYIQDNTNNTLVFRLDISNTSLPSPNRIDGVVLFVTNDTNNGTGVQYVQTFTRDEITESGGNCIVNGFTASNYSLTPGRNYTLTFKAYRDKRVSSDDAVYDTTNFTISDTVKSTVNFVFLASPIASVYDDAFDRKTINQHVTDLITVSNVVKHHNNNENPGGAPDKFQFQWYNSTINDVIEYTVHKVTPANGNVGESEQLVATIQAIALSSSNYVYYFQDDIPHVATSLIYDIRKSYNGRLSAATRLVFNTSKVITSPATITIKKQDTTHVLVELADANLDIHPLSVLESIVIKDQDNNTVIYSSNNGVRNSNGNQNILELLNIYTLGETISLKQEYTVEWKFQVNDTQSPTISDSYYGPVTNLVVASKPDISLNIPHEPNSNLTSYLGNTAIKLKLNSVMGNGSQGQISPYLTTLVILMTQDTVSVNSSTQVSGAENVLIFRGVAGGVINKNEVYVAESDFSSISLNIGVDTLTNNTGNQKFQLHTGTLDQNDTSYIVFPAGNNDYVSMADINIMILAINPYGVDTYVESFFFLNSPTFTQNGLIVTGGSFVLESTQDMSGISFMATYPISNSSGLITYSSSNPLVATVNAATGLITNVGPGTTDIIMLQASSVNHLSSSIKATYSVYVPDLFYYTVLNYGFDPASSVQLTPPTSPSPGAFTYTVTGNTDIVSIVGNSAVMRTAGTTTIRVTQAASYPYRSAYIDVPLSLTPIVSDWGLYGGTFIGSGIGSQVAISGDGTTYSIGSINNVYRHDPSKIFAQMDESQPNVGPIGFKRLGQRIPGVGGSGYRVALSNDGNTIVYADPMSSLSGINAGNAWVYSYNPVNDTWTPKGGRINGFAREGFLGTSVSISYDGSIVAVSGGGGEWRRGVVSVFAYDQNKTVAQLDPSHPDFGPVNWTRVGGDIVGPNNNEMLGTVIKLSSDGSIIATSSYHSGCAKIFKRDPSAPNGWHQMGNTIVSNQNGGWFGYAMDMSYDGKTICIGEPRNRGEVKIYSYNNIYNSWEPTGHIQDVNSGGSFGHSVGISSDGKTISIGAPNSKDGSGGLEQTGKVSIYRRDTYKTVSQSNPDIANYDPDGWTKVGTDIISKEKFSEFGEDVSMSGSGDIVMIGASGILPRQGIVQIYKWGQVSTFGPFNINPELKVYKNQHITRLLIPPSTNANGSFSFISSDTNVAEITLNNNLWYLTVKMPGSSIITAVQAASPTFIRSIISTELVVMAMYPLLGDFNLPSDLIYTPSSIVNRTLTPPTSNSQGHFTFTSSNLNVATIQLINGVYSINIVGSGNTKITAIQAVSGIYASASASHLLNTATGDISGFSIIDDSDFAALDSDFVNSNMTLLRSGDSGTGLIRRNENFYNSYVIYFNGTHRNYYVFTQDGALIFDHNGLNSSPDGEFDNGTSSQVPIKKFSFFGTDLVSEVRSKSILNDTMILVKVSGYKYGDPSKTVVIKMMIDLRGGMKINYNISPSFNADKVNIGYVHTDTNSTNDDLFLTLRGFTFNDSYSNIYDILNGKTITYNIDRTQFIRSGLLAHYDASNQQSLTISQFYATQWKDVSGNGYHLLNASTGPGPMMSRINNIPALLFTTGFYQSQSLVPMSENVTLFMVINYSSDIAFWGSFFHHGFRDTNFNVRRNSISATNYNLDFAISGNGLAELPMSPGRNYIIVGCINGNNVKFMSYSLQDSTRTTNEYITTAPLIPGNKRIYVGKSDRGDYPELCNSTMGEIMYYNVALSNDDINTNIKYLRNKWMSHTIPLYT